MVGQKLHRILLTLLLIGTYLLPGAASAEESQVPLPPAAPVSVGIIGGADGPTSAFVALSPVLDLFGDFAGMALTTNGVIFCKPGRIMAGFVSSEIHAMACGYLSLSFLPGRTVEQH